MTDDLPEGITLIGTSFKVSATEKVSTGQYENYNPTVTLEGELPAAVHLNDHNREAVKEQLLKLHGDIQKVLSRAAGNRVAEPEYENWTFQEESGGTDTTETEDETND